MGPHPPFCKVATFCLHFAFILSFHFCCCFKLSSDTYCDAHTPPPYRLMMPLPPSFPRLSTANATPSLPVVTTPTPVTQPAQAVNGRKMMAMRAQMMATRCLGSRYTLFLFVSSFYKLTNCNLSFLGSILVTTGADVA